MLIAKAGQAVTVKAEVRNGLEDPPDVFTPSGGVTFTLIDPAGTTQVNDQAMTAVSVGRYVYTYQTTGGSVLGVWTGSVKSVHSGVTGQGATQPLFELQ